MRSTLDFIQLDKKLIKSFQEELKNRFLNNEDIKVLTKDLSKFTQEMVFKYWQHFNLLDIKNLSLIALGSFGRNELQPYSDLDILILNKNSTEKFNQDIEKFIQSLWDLGFKVGHQLCNLQQCLELAETEISFISSLMDLRLIAGDKSLFDELSYAISPIQLWPSKKFFNAKWSEQEARHKKFNSTAYNLEPDIKNGPGGMRDLQMILWIAKRHFGEKDLNECLASGLITEKEFQTLQNCQLFLWQIRFALHMVANRSEDRLIFNYQKTLADFLGYKNNTNNSNAAVESLMKTYFQNIKLIRELNELFLQLFREVIFLPKHNQIKIIDHNFQINNQYIEVKNLESFKNKPILLLKLFDSLYPFEKIKGIRGNSMRLLKKYNYLIDSSFRVNTQHNLLFLKLLRKHTSVYKILKAMHRFGILNRYLPEFANISGQMQYDLFHVYTVDQHTLFVVKNLISFQEKNTSHKLCHKLISTFSKKEILYIAALYHDIGKGQSVDHSMLGEKLARSFCKRHSLSTEDSQLICFMVKNHLLMSHTAQRKDLDDHKVIEHFCLTVENQQNLSHLYLLTVADVCATNPKLWNSWRESLLKNLFFKAINQFKTSNKFDEKALILKKQNQCMPLISTIKKELIYKHWQTLKSDYFLQNPSQTIAFQTKKIINSQSFPLILIKPHHTNSGTQLMIYMPVCNFRFSITTTILNNFNLTIVEAKISECKNNYALDNYIILDQNNRAITSNKLIEELKQGLINHLTPPITIPRLIKRYITKRQKDILLKPIIKFNNDLNKDRTEVLLVTTDRSGLLANLSHIFNKHDIEIQNAKISTSGEHVEDTFFITHNKIVLSLTKQNELEKAIFCYLTS